MHRTKFSEGKHVRDSMERMGKKEPKCILQAWIIICTNFTSNLELWINIHLSEYRNNNLQLNAAIVAKTCMRLHCINMTHFYGSTYMNSSLFHYIRDRRSCSYKHAHVKPNAE